MPRNEPKFTSVFPPTSSAANMPGSSQEFINYWVFHRSLAKPVLSIIAKRFPHGHNNDTLSWPWRITTLGSGTQPWRQHPFLDSLTTPFVHPIKVNERNPNNKSLNKSVKKKTKLSTYFRPSEWTK
jgi:hypothetical protein